MSGGGVGVLLAPDTRHPTSAFRRPGGFGEVSEPDPIPNSEVKRLSADGTMSQDLGE